MSNTSEQAKLSRRVQRDYVVQYQNNMRVVDRNRPCDDTVRNVVTMVDSATSLVNRFEHKWRARQEYHNEMIACGKCGREVYKALMREQSGRLVCNHC